MARTIIERSIEEAHSQERGIEWRAALTKRLGDGKDWKFTGEVADGGINSQAKCACNHPIRWIFIIQNKKDGRLESLGSTCICYFAGINPEAFEALTAAHEELLQKLANLKSREKKAQAEAETDKAKILYEETYNRAKALYTENRDAERRSSRSLWAAFESWKFRQPAECPKRYTRTSDYRKWYEKNTEYLVKVIRDEAEYRAGS